MAFNFGSSASTGASFAFGQSSGSLFGSSASLLAAGSASSAQHFGSFSSSAPAFGTGFGSSSSAITASPFLQQSSGVAATPSSSVGFALGTGFGTSTSSAPPFAPAFAAATAGAAAPGAATFTPAGFGSSAGFAAAFGSSSTQTQPFSGFSSLSGSQGSASAPSFSFGSTAASIPSLSVPQSASQTLQAMTFPSPSSTATEAAKAQSLGQSFPSLVTSGSGFGAASASSASIGSQPVSFPQSQSPFASTGFNLSSSSSSFGLSNATPTSSTGALSFSATSVGGLSSTGAFQSALAAPSDSFTASSLFVLPSAQTGTAASGTAKSTETGMATNKFASSSFPALQSSPASATSSDAKDLATAASKSASSTANNTPSFASKPTERQENVAQFSSTSKSSADTKPAGSSDSTVSPGFSLTASAPPQPSTGSTTAGFGFAGGLASNSAMLGAPNAQLTSAASKDKPEPALSLSFSLPSTAAASAAVSSQSTSADQSGSKPALPALSLTPPAQSFSSPSSSFSTSFLQTSQALPQTLSHTSSATIADTSANGLAPAPTSTSAAAAAATAAATATATAAAAAGTGAQTQVEPTAAAVPSDIRNLNLDDVLNKWTDEIDDLASQFVNAAGLVSKWDRNIIANEKAISDLWKETQCCSVAHSELSSNLDTILSQQKDLHQMLDALEREMDEIDRRQPSGTSGTAGGSLNADVEREAMHSLANEVMTDLDGMAVTLRDLVLELNKSSAADSGDAVSQVVAVLNAHLDSLQYLDESSNQLQRRLIDVSRACEAISHDTKSYPRRF